jgi:Zn-dependent protease
MVLALLFLTVLLHEFGHCFAARRVGGEANEVLLWPLGGLAACDVPHNPRAHFVNAAGGPAVNVLICLASAVALSFLFDVPYRPTWNPFWYPYRIDNVGTIEMYRWDGTPAATANVAVLVLARLFWVSWATLLLNIVLIGFPFDGGRMFQSALWPHFGYRQATLYAVVAGFICMFVLLVVSIAQNEVLWLFLAFFTYTACRQEWITLESGGEESLFGYDFSQGYTSLERDEPPPARTRRKKVNFLQRWLQRRAARKQQVQQENAEAEARRVDELLDKIQQHGKQALTDEENRFLKRYADRMKNK